MIDRIERQTRSAGGRLAIRRSRMVNAALAMFLAGICAGCGNSPAGPGPSRPEVPVVTPPPPPPPSPPAHVPSWPAVSQPARVYEADFRYPYGGYATRYLLYDSGSFSLQFSGPTQLFEYLGSYTETAGVIEFRFKANEPQWVASGKIHDESLDVSYNMMMLMDDFVDGRYLRVR